MRIYRPKSLSEADYQNLLLATEEARPNPESIADAVLITVAANSTDSVGVVGNDDGPGEIDTRHLVVARQLHFSGGQLQATSFYQVPTEVRGWVSHRGSAVQLGFTSLPLELDFRSGGCGPLMIPGVDLPCKDGYCLDGVSWMPHQGDLGRDRIAAGKPRATIRLPLKLGGLWNEALYACSLFQPPLPLPPVFCGPINPLTGEFMSEECNGIDDNCNGQIDELACEVWGACTFTPRTCEQTRCATIPDGCGGTVACPCP